MLIEELIHVLDIANALTVLTWFEFRMFCNGIILSCVEGYLGDLHFQFQAVSVSSQFDSHSYLF